MTPTLNNRLSAIACSMAALAIGLGVARPASAQATVKVQPQTNIELTEQELAIWEDPDFRRRFVESYLSETDLEPKPSSPEEVDVINETLRIMSPPAEPSEPEEGDEADDDDDDRDASDGDAAEAQEPEDPATRLKRALEYVTTQRAQNESFSVLVDFLAANLQLNMAMNIEEPAEGASDAVRGFYEARKKKLLREAAKGYRNCATQFPKYRRAWRNLGIVSLRLQDYEQAREAFSKVIMLGGGDPDTYGLLGFCYTTLGDHLPAESAFRMANLLDPSKNDWRMGMIRSFLLQKRYSEAIAMTGQMLEEEPTNDRLWLFQANAYIGMEQFAKAAENYEILDGLGKSTVQSLSMLANIYTNRGLFETAVERYQQAIEIASADKRGDLLPQLMNAAQVLASRGEESRDATKALIDTITTQYEGTIEKDQLTTLLRLNARLALAEGDDEGQAKILEEVVKLNPLDGEALILLGQHYARLQEWPKAISFYERAANIEGFEADAKVRHAQALVLSDRASQALPLLRQAQQIKPRESVQQYLEAVERMNR